MVLQWFPQGDISKRYHLSETSMTSFGSLCFNSTYKIKLAFFYKSQIFDHVHKLNRYHLEETTATSRPSLKASMIILKKENALIPYYN
jgi:hypothetical protein